MPHSSSIFIVGKHRISINPAWNPSRTFDLKMDHFDPGGYFQAFVPSSSRDLPKTSQNFNSTIPHLQRPLGEGRALGRTICCFPFITSSSTTNYEMLIVIYEIRFRKSDKFPFAPCTGTFRGPTRNGRLSWPRFWPCPRAAASCSSGWRSRSLWWAQLLALGCVRQ